MRPQTKINAHIGKPDMREGMVRREAQGIPTPRTLQTSAQCAQTVHQRTAASRRTITQSSLRSLRKLDCLRRFRAPEPFFRAWTE